MAVALLSRRNIDFLLFEWLDVTNLTARARFSEHSRETFDATLDAYVRIATDHFAPHNRNNDVNEPQFAAGEVRVNPDIKPALEVFAEAGLMAATRDYDLGGMQLPYVVDRAGMLFLFAANISTAAYPMLTMANANLLSVFAAPEILALHLADMLRGHTFGTMCLSEPQAGSSLADITTRAEPQSDGRYRVFGNKMWISGGDHDLSENIVHLVLAKIPGADGKLLPGVGGISLFLVPKFLKRNDGSLADRNDVVVAGVNHKMGYRGTSNCLLNFGEGAFRPGGAAGAIGDRVGAAGQGLACMFHMMNEARISVGAGAAALGSTGYLHALEYARNRRQGRVPQENAAKRLDSPPVPIIQHGDVKRMLLAQKAYVEGALSLVLYCAKLVDEVVTGKTAESRADADILLGLLTPIAKSWPSKWCLLANDLAIQVHGGYGYTRDYPVEQFWRDNRLNPIHEGTHGVQAADLLGRKVSLDGGKALVALGARIEEALAAATAYPMFGKTATGVGHAWQQLIEVTTKLQALPVARRLDNAAPYLDAFGHIVIGWLWLEQAILAKRHLGEAPAGEAAFYRGKIQACEWFAIWELPSVYAWLSVLDPMDATVSSMEEDWF